MKNKNETENTIISILSRMTWKQFLITISITSGTIVFAFYLAISFISENQRRNILSDEAICKGAIAAISGLPYQSNVNTIETSIFGVVELYYIRKFDGTRWDFRCRVSGDSVEWATKDGRWRTQAEDAVVKWKYNPKNKVLVINQSFPDGSESSKKFGAVY